MQKAIRSVEAQTNWMERVTNLIKDPSSQERAMIGPMALQILAAEPLMAPARHALKDHGDRRRRAVMDCHEALRKLSQFCSNALNMQDLRFGHVDASAEVKDTFKLRMPRPKSLTDRGWITIGKDLLFAEQRAVDAGLEPMVYPTAAELQVVLDAASEACAELDRVSMRYREAAAEMRSLNDEVGQLVLDTAAWFRFSLRRKAKPEQRDIMRRFGFTFSGDLSTEPPSDPGGEPTGSGDPQPAEPNTGQGNEPTQNEPVTGNETNEPTPNTPSNNEGNKPTTGTDTTPTPTTQTPTAGDTKPATPNGSSNGPVDSDASTGTAGSTTTETPPIVQDRPSNNGRD